MGRFLSYVVNQKLAGKEDDLKAYTIAVDALGRSEDFDPQNDPSVRVLAGRLRTSLAEYYSDEGAGDPIRILVPTGTYRPTFSTANFENAVQKGRSSDTPSETEEKVTTEPAKNGNKRWKLATLALFLLLIAGVLWTLFGWQENETPLARQNAITIVVTNSSDTGSAQSQRASTLLRNLRASLSRIESIVILSGSGEDIAKDFLITGTLQQAGDEERFVVELINARTDQLVWARTYPIREGSDSDTAIANATRELDTQIFGASIKALEGRDPQTLSAEQLFVLATWVPGPAKSTLAWEKERVELARLALEKDPDFGPAHSVLADKLAYLSAVDGPSNTEEALKEAKFHARRAQELSPGDSIAVFNTAQSAWHSGDLSTAIVRMNRVVELNPNFGLADFFSDVIPYSCYAAPDSVMANAIKFDQSLAADNPVRWVTLTWLGWLHLNRDELNLALRAEQRAAQIFRIPYTVMRHAVVLNELGRTEEAIELLNNQRRSNWPNIDPQHFASVTMARLCEGEPRAAKMIGLYQNLADAVKGKLK